MGSRDRATAGLGLSVAESLAGAGANVVLHDLIEPAQTRDRLRTQFGVDAISVAADLSQRAAIEAMMADLLGRLSAIDILVNNAVVRHFSPVEHFSPERWEEALAVNLSPRQFADERLLHDVDDALAASGMSPVLLQLEVTESMVMRNVSRAVKVLDAIQSRGIRLAIDDFGTGYSSMSLMKQFPIDTIKIDRSFVRDLPRDSEDQAIAQAIISMGKALGMTVIAEGVETDRAICRHGRRRRDGGLPVQPGRAGYHRCNAADRWGLVRRMSIIDRPMFRLRR